MYFNEVYLMIYIEIYSRMIPFDQYDSDIKKYLHSEIIINYGVIKETMNVLREKNHKHHRRNDARLFTENVSLFTNAMNDMLKSRNYFRK